MSFELFADRFLNPTRLFEDPSFTLWAAEDLEKNREVLVQALWSPGLRDDVGLVRQCDALQAFEDARGREPSEWITFRDQALLIRPRIVGRRLASVAETQRDEVYLQWLRQALEILSVHHAAGLWHLAQNPFSWVLTPEEDGGEGLALVDLALFPDLPLGMRVHPENVAALAPEFFGDAPLDARSDLYALACLILRQRSPKVFERVRSVGAWLDLHLGARVAALVPKTVSPLNELLRKMLQPDPQARPADALAALAEIPGAEVPAAVSAPVADWIYERVLRRQATVFFRCAYDLLQAGDPRSRDLIERCPVQLREVYPALHAYLRMESARRGGDDALFQAGLEEVEAHLERRPDPRLRALSALSESRLRLRRGDGAGHSAALQRAEAAMQGCSDPELSAELHGERALAAFAGLDETLALAEWVKAWRLLSGIEAVPLCETVGLALANSLGSHGQEAAAWRIVEVLLAAPEIQDPAGVELAAALLAMRLRRFEAAKDLFYRAKSRISAQKDLPRLIWASTQELRLFLAQGDFTQAMRELRVLKVRARSQAEPPELLGLVELAAALMMAPGLAPPHSEALGKSLAAWACGAAPFRDLSWSAAESCEWLGRAAALWGRETEAEQLAARAARLRPILPDEKDLFPRPESNKPVASEIVSDKTREAVVPPTPQAIPTQTSTNAEAERLRTENRALKERIRRLEQELSQRRSEQAGQAGAGAAVSPADCTELAAVRELMEKRSIVAMLRKHMGNRIEAARELKIHRRTLFEKIRRYGLSEADFMPGFEEIEATLAECGGNKSQAAERLGMSRSSFYRWLKDLKK